MKNEKTEHFWHIHKKVLLRVWGDLTDDIRNIIVSDDLHISEAYQWFDAKVMADATRLYEDPDYYANDRYSFLRPKESWQR